MDTLASIASGIALFALAWVWVSVAVALVAGPVIKHGMGDDDEDDVDAAARGTLPDDYYERGR